VLDGISDPTTVSDLREIVNDDARHMARALALAERGRGHTSPNPMVGALIVDDTGVVVGRGAHQFAGGPHAEVHALADAGGRARGATLYCTLEPCTHVGRTGPCAPRVIESGIRRAVIAIEDPNPLVAGRGIALLRHSGVEVTLGVLRERAARLNQAFFTMIRLKRPMITLKAALSIDGRVSDAPGVRTPLTGASADRFIHRERAEIDALAIGSGTLLTDDPLLTARGAYRTRPLTRVVFDRRLRTPAAARVLSTISAGPVIIMSTADAARQAGERMRALQAAGAVVECVDPADSPAFLGAAVRRLAERQCSSMVVEGGPTLHAAFWRAELVDRLEVFVTPHVAGPSGPPWDVLPTGAIADLDERSAMLLGDDVLIQGYVHRSD
jgi:diaminohydroxyphosphoribosylaminopyrimidine deaminase/5-amino-6-(5-phosphoribosylamino)uracil reductase